MLQEVSVNATIFTSEMFKDFCHSTGIFRKFIALGHPVTNGLTEHYVQSLKQKVAAMANEPPSVFQKVPEILFHYRAKALANGKTPSEPFQNR